MRGGEGTVRCGVLATYYLLTTYSLDTLTRLVESAVDAGLAYLLTHYTLARLVESAVGEHMYEGRHGSGAQQQRRTELGSSVGE